MEQIDINGRHFRGDTIPLPNISLLVIQGDKGILGCGYLSVEAADKFGHALAVVTGVSCYDDMLTARVAKVSRAAAALGVAVGDTGREALLKMNG